MYIVNEINDYLESCGTHIQVRYGDDGMLQLQLGSTEIFPDVSELKQIVKVLNKAIRDVK